MNLYRLVLTFKGEGLEVRTLYKRKDGPNPGTKARRLEVQALARDGLVRALEALDAGEVADLGTSGYETREDTFLCATKGVATPPVHKKPTKRSAA